MTTPNLTLAELAASQSQPHVTVNSALRVLDALVFLRFRQMGLNAPPAGSPTVADGFCYQVTTGSPSASGDWAGHDGDVAYYSGGGWLFVTPQEGWLAWDMSNPRLLVYYGGAWVELVALP